MDLVLRNLPRTCVYLDGILVANEIEEQHRLDLIALFDTLETNGLIINKAKCVFGVKSLDFLRNQFYNNGIKPLPEKTVLSAISHVRRLRKSRGVSLGWWISSNGSFHMLQRSTRRCTPHFVVNHRPR